MSAHGWSKSAREAAARARAEKRGLKGVAKVGSTASSSSGFHFSITDGNKAGRGLKPTDFKFQGTHSGTKLSSAEKSFLKPRVRDLKNSSLDTGQKKGAAIEKLMNGESLSREEVGHAASYLQGSYNSQNFGGGRTYKAAPSKSRHYSNILSKFGTEPHENFKKTYEGQNASKSAPLHEEQSSAKALSSTEQKAAKVKAQEEEFQSRHPGSRQGNRGNDRSPTATNVPSSAQGTNVRSSAKVHKGTLSDINAVVDGTSVKGGSEGQLLGTKTSVLRNTASSLDHKSLVTLIAKLTNYHNNGGRRGYPFQVGQTNLNMLRKLAGAR